MWQVIKPDFFFTLATKKEPLIFRNQWDVECHQQRFSSSMHYIGSLALLLFHELS